tara:strand:+ start:25 stop:534 length:510 start_codon:yes stop_codon:yes gene_type:complete
MAKSNRFFLIMMLMLGCLCTSTHELYGQSTNPEFEPHEDLVKWSSVMKYVSTDSLQITFHVELAHGWAIYSQYQQGTGPIPTSINVSNMPQVTFREQSVFGSDGYDSIWDLPIKKFVNEVYFISSTFEVPSEQPGITSVKGHYEFMICDSMQCLPPEWVDFEIQIPGQE